MIVNMYEYKIIFGHQFLNAIQNVTFTVIQPRRMFKKGVMVDVQEFIILVCSFFYACHTCASVETPYGIQKKCCCTGSLAQVRALTGMKHLIK